MCNRNYNGFFCHQQTQIWPTACPLSAGSVARYTYVGALMKLEGFLPTRAYREYRLRRAPKSTPLAILSSPNAHVQPVAQRTLWLLMPHSQMLCRPSPLPRSYATSRDPSYCKACMNVLLTEIYTVKNSGSKGPKHTTIRTTCFAKKTLFVANQ